MEAPNEMRARVAGMAADDEGFRAALLDDPKGAIGQALGVSMPASLTIKVHEDSATTAHLVLPPSSKLSEADLRHASGGSWVAQPGNDDVAAADHNPRSGLNW